MIRPCTCSNTYQDYLHGKGNRVMNETKKGSFVKCTVCTKEYPISNKKKEKNEKGQ